MSELLAAAWAGLAIVCSWPNILYPVIGTLLAMVFSFLPGVSGLTLMALAMPLTLAWEPVPVMLLYGAFVGGATFMGSITAILFNVPGTAPSAATMLDGYPMARNGEAGTAIGCAAAASALGSTFGVLVLIAMLPVVRGLILSFGPPEFLLLCVWGLTTIALVGRSDPIKSLAMAGLGLVLALVGMDPRTAEPRFALGTDYLADGLPPVAVLLGLFGVAEMLELMSSNQRAIAIGGRRGELSGNVWAGCLAVLGHKFLLLRSSLIGTLIGIVPGVGGTVASFVAYGHAVQSARPPTRFGKGDIRGVIAPEAAHDAKDGGSLLPTLAFGVPGSEGTALLLAAMAVHGITPGRRLLAEGLPLAFALIWSLFLSNWLTSLLGLAVARPAARLTTIRQDLLAPVILALVAIAAIADRGQPLDLVVVAAFGIVGLVLQRHGWPRVPFVIAFVLGAAFEDNLLLTLRLIDLGRVDLADRPLTWLLVLLVLATMAWMWRTSRKLRAEA